MVQGFENIFLRTCVHGLKMKQIFEDYLAAKVFQQDVLIISNLIQVSAPYKSSPVCQIDRKDYAGEEKAKQGWPVSLMRKLLQQILKLAKQCRFGRLRCCTRCGALIGNNSYLSVFLKLTYLSEESVQSPSLVEPASASSSVTLEWRYNEDDQAHPAFITGYLVTVKEVAHNMLPGHAGMCRLKLAMFCILLSKKEENE